ncbi:hypothetical protein [Leptolyngbya sp. FACHB-17]|uniref:hypothetical protein n=1 Tax=Leptolyngbya sp. FACHB-17 TaxID=2692803 RepID=UPI0019A8E4F0|nr:hypothetical protein [Leptolyngbya sp. FACHB-17]MBD2078419.1 hypothetical protein [Leptolyngbya sp. FACHB-17]
MRYAQMAKFTGQLINDKHRYLHAQEAYRMQQTSSLSWECSLLYHEGISNDR